MFTRNHRTYLSNPPEASQYVGNVPKGGVGPGVHKQKKGQREKKQTFKEEYFTPFSPELVKSRFPNHDKNVIANTTNLIG